MRDSKVKAYRRTLRHREKLVRKINPNDPSLPGFNAVTELYKQKLAEAEEVEARLKSLGRRRRLQTR